MHALNDPSVLSQVAALHDAYERALVSNDVASLNAAFWDSPHTVRFGVSEHLYGAEAIAAYRQDAPPRLLDRRVTRRTIVAFGADCASVMCELTQTVAGRPRHSRQSQLWVRFPEVGWKIVAAHVSHALSAAGESWSDYVDRVARVLDVPVAPEHRPGVVQNLQRASALATPLMEFSFPDTAEIAPVFSP